MGDNDFVLILSSSVARLSSLWGEICLQNVSPLLNFSFLGAFLAPKHEARRKGGLVHVTDRKAHCGITNVGYK